MTNAGGQGHRQVIVLLFYAAGSAAVLLGVADLAVGNFGVRVGLLLLFGGLGGLALAQLFKLLGQIAGHLCAIRSQLGVLTEIEGDLSAMRAQMNRGVLGLLG